jgi:polyferredoxin
VSTEGVRSDQPKINRLRRSFKRARREEMSRDMKRKIVQIIIGSLCVVATGYLVFQAFNASGSSIIILVALAILYALLAGVLLYFGFSEPYKYLDTRERISTYRPPGKRRS